MKKIIRTGVFETNSSSTHTLVIMNEADYNKWKEADTYRVESTWGLSKIFEGKDTVTSQEVYDLVIEAAKDPANEKQIGWLLDSCEGDTIETATKEEIVDYFVSNGDLDSYDSFINDDYLETSEYEHVTPNGEVVKIVAKYGMDG